MATVRTVTVKPSGGDYTSLSNAEAGEQGDLPTLDRQLNIECYSMEDTTATSIDGWTTDATRFISIYAPAAERHDGKWNANKYRIEVSSGASHPLSIYDDFVRLAGLQISMPAASADKGAVELDWNGTPCDIRITETICKQTSESSTIIQAIRCGYSRNSDTGRTILVANCIFYDWATSSSGGTWCSTIYVGTGYTVYVKNVTIVDSVKALQQTGGTLYASNMGASNCAYADEGTITKTTCSTSTPTFVDGAADNFHLASGDTTWKGQGTDLASDSPYPITIDIDYQTRSGSWDIGADEYVAAGGLSIPVAMHYAAMRRF